MSEPQLGSIDAVQRKTFVTYTVPEDLTLPAPSLLTLLESPAVLAASSTTGLRTWEAALFLGTYLTTPAGRHWVRGQNVLELGAGTGFISMLAAKHLGARFVMATDGSSQVVDDLVTNLGLNGLADSDRIGTAVLKWGHALSDSVLQPLVRDQAAEAEDQIPYELILAADVVGSVPPR